MKKDYKDIWKKLKDCINLEKKLASKELSRYRKNNDFVECLEAKNHIASMDWVENEMENLEDTGEVL